MKNNRVRFVLGAMYLTVASATFAAPPPISAFARLEQLSSVRLSPDGKRLVFLSESQGKRVAMTLDLETPGASPHLILAGDKQDHFDLQGCRWAKNTRLLCNFVAPIEEYRVTYRFTKMVAVNADGSNVKVLLQNSPLVSGAQFLDRVVDFLRDNPETVLIEAPDSDAMGHMERGSPAVWELNIYNGQLKKVMPQRASIWSYLSDGKGNIRLATGSIDRYEVYFARLKGETEWRQLAKVKPFEPLRAMIPIEVIPDTNKAYAIGPSGDRQALWLIDLEDKEAPQLLFEHPVADIDEALIDDEGKLWGVYYELDRPFIYYTDDRLGAVMDAIKKSLPDTFNVIASRSHDGKKMVIRAISDREAGAYYLFDATSGKFSRLGRSYPELDVAQLPRMRAIEYAAADGTKIPGYLTTPVGVREEKLPLIVFPHGGPIARDNWNFDFLRMFLASRGYAVLQMEFRGSAGYGFDWQIAAHQDWGGLTYNDILDGTRWAISKGIADPNRICIVGWSFGGYAALTGAVRNSDLFKCSVSIAGVSDLSQLIRNQLNFVGGAIAWEQIGTDPAKLKANSPVKHAEDVKMPMLMLHGTLDAQVPYVQSEEMANALKKAGKNYKFITIKDADHNLWRESERTTLLTELEQFLQTNLGPGAAAN